MTETKYTAGRVFLSQGTSPQDARDGSSFTNGDALAESLDVGQLQEDPTFYWCYQFFLEFDTSALHPLSDAFLSFYLTSSGELTEVFEVYEYDWGASLGNEDWRDSAWLESAELLCSLSIAPDLGETGFLVFANEGTRLVDAISGSVLRIVVAARSHRVDADVGNGNNVITTLGNGANINQRAFLTTEVTVTDATVVGVSAAADADGGVGTVIPGRVGVMAGLRAGRSEVK